MNTKNLKYDGVSDQSVDISNILDDLEGLDVSDVSVEYQDRIFDISTKIAQNRMQKGQQITSPDCSRKAISELLKLKQEEVMSVLFLDNKHRIICFEELFKGSINSASVYTRVLVKRVLSTNSSAIILAHNHPSGDYEPSRADKAITGRIKEAMGLVEVRLLDHFIVGVEGIYSFAENGEI